MIWNRKLGVFELLFAMAIFELVVGNRPRALVAAGFAVLAWYTKKKFAGEFSLADAWSVATGAGKRAAEAVEKEIN